MVTSFLQAFCSALELGPATVECGHPDFEDVKDVTNEPRIGDCHANLNSSVDRPLLRLLLECWPLHDLDQAQKFICFQHHI